MNTSAALATLASIIGSTALSCAPLAGVDDKPCRPACVDGSTRLICIGDKPMKEACPAPQEPCTRATCSAGQCGVAPAEGRACGPDGAARCNAGYACLGPQTRLSAILDHTCLVADDGKVWCWGLNPFGELGDGTTEDRTSPVTARGLPGPAVDVSAGYGHTCAVLEDGRIACWGNNLAAQCGTGLAGSPLLQPAIVDVPSVRFTSVAAGRGHTCATTDRGLVYCWGTTIYGVTGREPADVGGQLTTAPVLIAGLDSVTSIETVKDHTCAVRTSAPTLMCWGSNSYLEYKAQPGAVAHKLGPGAQGRLYSATPVEVPLPVTVRDVGMGYESTYAVGVDDVAYAWGYNESHQLGTGSTEIFGATPQPVKTNVPKEMVLGDVRDVLRTDGSDQCAELHSPLLTSRFVCWGTNNFGELGFVEEDALHRNFPFATSTRLPDSARNLVRGEDHGCFLADGGDAFEVWCFGQPELVGAGPVTVPEGTRPQPRPVPAPVMWNREFSEAAVR